MRFFYSNVASSPRIGLHAIGIAQCEGIMSMSAVDNTR